MQRVPTETDRPPDGRNTADAITQKQPPDSLAQARLKSRNKSVPYCYK